MRNNINKTNYIAITVLLAGMVLFSAPSISRIAGDSGICLADTFLAGSVSGDWYASSGNFLIFDSIYISLGNTLTIHPGVVIKFNNYNHGLLVTGTLIAEGTEEDSITFTSSLSYPSPGAWERIYFNGPTANNSRMSYCRVKYAVKGIRLQDSSPYIEHSSFLNCEEQGIYASNTFGHFDSCEVSNSGLTGMIFFEGSPIIRYNHSHHNGNTGITLNGVYGGEASYNVLDYNTVEGLLLDNGCVGGLDIYNNFISYNSSYGMRVNDSYTSGLYIEIYHNVIYKNLLDGAYIDASNIRFVNNTVTDNSRDGIFLYGSASIFYNNIIDNNDSRGVYMQNPVSATIDYNDVWDNSTNYLGCNAGLHDISANPLYVAPTEDDYHITINSPCKDAGNPASIYNDPDATRADIGALYYNQSGIIDFGGNNIPENAVLIQNFPNPFNSETIIQLTGNVDGLYIEIFNIAGQCVRSIEVSPNVYDYKWDGKDNSGKAAPAGVYFGRAGESNTLKMILLK